MKPVKFKEANVEIGKPVDMTDEQCGALPAFKGVDRDGFPVIVSCWEVSPSEMNRIRESGKIWLVVIGETTPPAHIATDIDFK